MPQGEKASRPPPRSPCQLSFLPVERWGELRAIFEAEGCPLPTPETARILAALGPDGTVAGFVVIQLVLHVEPLYVDPAYRQGGVARHLAKAACQTVTPGVPYYVFAPRHGVARLAQANGLKARPWRVFQGMN